MPVELPPDLLEDARGFVRNTTWTYARTMPENSHWYIVIPKVTDHRVDALLTLLAQYSWVRRWGGRAYETIDLDAWSYWWIEPVVNRKPVRFAGWAGDPQQPAPHWLPDGDRRDLPGDEVPDWLYGPNDEANHWGVDPDSGVEP